MHTMMEKGPNVNIQIQPPTDRTVSPFFCLVIHPGSYDIKLRISRDLPFQTDELIM
jgi:hypothetical protein